MINTKNSVHYKADLITETAVQDFEDVKARKQIFTKTFGTSVDIWVDTIFKKYTIIYLDENYKSAVMPYSYLGDYYIDAPKGSKIYLMDLSGYQHKLVDGLWTSSHAMEIYQEEKLINNTTLIFNIKDAYKVNN